MYSLLEDHLVGLGVNVSDSNHEVAGSVACISTNFKCELGLERSPPSLVRTIG